MPPNVGHQFTGHRSRMQFGRPLHRQANIDKEVLASDGITAQENELISCHSDAPRDILFVLVTKFLLLVYFIYRLCVI